MHQLRKMTHTTQWHTQAKDQNEVKWSILLIAEAQARSSPSTARLHWDMENITATTLLQWSRVSSSLPVSHAIDLLYSGQNIGSNVCSTIARWRRRSKKVRSAVGVEGEEVSISAVPTATHLPLSVTSYYFDTNTTCTVEYDLHKRDWGGLSFPVLFKK